MDYEGNRVHITLYTQVIYREFKRGEAPFFNILPPMIGIYIHIMDRGDKGGEVDKWSLKCQPQTLSLRMLM